MNSINCSGNTSTTYEQICGGLEIITEYYKCTVYVNLNGIIKKK